MKISVYPHQLPRSNGISIHFIPELDSEGFQIAFLKKRLTELGLKVTSTGEEDDCERLAIIIPILDPITIVTPIP